MNSLAFPPSHRVGEGIAYLNQGAQHFLETNPAGVGARLTVPEEGGFADGLLSPEVARRQLDLSPHERQEMEAEIWRL